MNFTKHILSIITIACLSVAAIALRYAYICLPFFRKYLIIGISVIIVYLVITLWIVNKIQGKQKSIFHCLMLQIIPICMAVGTFVIVPKLQTRIYGKINKAELTFNDLQSKQIVSAQKLGIIPLNVRSDVAAYLTQSEQNKKLIKISSNSMYYVRGLTHSVPYLVPKAETLLSDIAREFQVISGTNSRFEVTSVLRTKEDIKKLQGSNANATTNSCHLYGTTFDISYARFRTDVLHPKSNAELREALAQAVYNLREQGRCLVKFEKKQKCYHITVR